MKYVVAIAIVGAIVWLVIMFARTRTASQGQTFATPDELPSIVTKLEKTGHDGSFVVFMFSLRGNRDDLFPNLQYSIENGRLGLDWVLLAPQNIKDESKLTDFIKGLGFSVLKREMNDVRYLRVEGNGLDNLGVRILRDFYHLKPDAKLELIIEEFQLNDSPK